MNAARLVAAGVLATLVAACVAADPGLRPSRSDESTLGNPSPGVSPSCPGFVLDRNDGECADRVELDGRTYVLGCTTVPEILIDVPLPARWGGAAVRAIAAVPSAWAVAVRAEDESCGTYALAMRDDLSPGTRNGIVEELERAADLPPDLG